MTSSLYTTDILRLAASIPHYGRLAQPQGVAEKRSPTCGSRVRVEVRLDGAGRVAALGQTVEACAFGQAAAALMGDRALGCDYGSAVRAHDELRSWLAREGETPGEWPGLEALSPARDRSARHGAMLLPFAALAAAIREAQ